VVKGVVLEHHRDVAVSGVYAIDDATCNRNLSCGDVFQARHHSKQGALAASAGADDDDELSVVDFGVYDLNGLDSLGALSVGLTDLLERNCTHHDSRC